MKRSQCAAARFSALIFTRKPAQRGVSIDSGGAEAAMIHAERSTAAARGGQAEVTGGEVVARGLRLLLLLPPPRGPRASLARVDAHVGAEAAARTPV